MTRIKTWPLRMRTKYTKIDNYNKYVYQGNRTRIKADFILSKMYIYHMLYNWILTQQQFSLVIISKNLFQIQKCVDR